MKNENSASDVTLFQDPPQMTDFWALSHPQIYFGNETSTTTNLVTEINRLLMEPFIQIQIL